MCYAELLGKDLRINADVKKGESAMSFEDFFKKSVLEMDAFANVSISNTLLGLLISFVIGLLIFYVYKKTFRGVVYSYNYNVSFVLMTVITTMIIMTISTNIVLSLGMVGALSIVRFRTAVKDPMDIVYMFWAISAGIATGAQIYTIAIAGSIFVSFIIYWLSRYKGRENAYILVMQFSDEATEPVVTRLRKHGYTLKSKTVRRDMTEMTVEVRLKDDNTAIVRDLAQLDGVKDVALVSYNGDYAP